MELPPPPIYPPQGPYDIQMGMMACGCLANNAPILSENILCFRCKGSVFRNSWKLIARNTQAEAIIKPHKMQCDGRADWKALKSHYKGIGIYNADIAKASHTINNLYYIHEKEGHMW